MVKIYLIGASIVCLLFVYCGMNSLNMLSFGFGRPQGSRPTGASMHFHK